MIADPPRLISIRVLVGPGNELDEIFGKQRGRSECNYLDAEHCFEELGMFPFIIEMQRLFRISMKYH